jgi:flagellar assembly factor FliW
MQVQSARFGTLSVDDDKIILFPKGLPGFEDERRFFLMDHAGSSKIKWLHSADNPGLALVVADPFDLFEEYRPDVPDEITRDLGLTSSDGALVLTVLTVRAGRSEGEPPTISANLLAPIVISRERRIGAQALLKSGEYGVRHQVPVQLGERAKQASGCGASSAGTSLGVGGEGIGATA